MIITAVKKKTSNDRLHFTPPRLAGIDRLVVSVFFSFLFLVLQVLSFFCGLFRKMVPS